MRPITFVEPQSLAGVLAALGDGDAATSRLIAGGSDLLGELKEGTVPYTKLVSLAGVDALRRVERHEDGLRIGALVTLAQLEVGEHLGGPYQILSEAARGVATPEIRNQATLGGNLCQRPRCLFYRHALTPCLKKGDNGCPAVESPHQAYLSIMSGAGCYSVNASDLAPPLIALGAVAVIAGPSGVRQMPLEAFFVGPEEDVTRENCLTPREILTAVVLPAVPTGWRGTYIKARQRSAGDFPLASVALGYDLRDGRIEHCRVVLGGVAPTPLRSRVAEQVLNGQEPTDAVAAQAAAAALSNAQPLAHNGFKVDLALALIRRSVTALAAARSGR